METRSWNHGAGQSQLKQQEFVSRSNERVGRSGGRGARDGISGDSQQPPLSQYTQFVQSTKLAREIYARAKCIQKYQDFPVHTPPPLSDQQYPPIVDLRKDLRTGVMVFFKHPWPCLGKVSWLLQHSSAISIHHRIKSINLQKVKFKGASSIIELCRQPKSDCPPNLPSSWKELKKVYNISCDLPTDYWPILTSQMDFLKSHVLKVVSSDSNVDS